MKDLSRYRIANESDFRQLKALRILAYSEFLDQLTPDNRQVLHDAVNSEERLHDIMQKATTFVYEEDDYIAGMAFLMPTGNPTNIYPADWAYIRMVGVDPAYRGKGIARTLTIMCIDKAREMGTSTIGLHTSEMMPAARHVYEALGFEIVKEIEPIFGRRYWLYALDISKQ